VAVAGTASEAVSVKGFVAALALGAAVSTIGAQAPARVVALDPANRDTTCAACTDFFRFANGGWLKTVTIPPTFAYYGAFEEVRDHNTVVLRQILEADSGKLGTFYASCMDTVTRDARGIAALRSELDVVAAIRTPDDVAGAFATLQHLGNFAPWSAGSAQDDKDAASVVATIEQGGLPLPGRDYYLKGDSDSRRIMTGYHADLAAMFLLLGDAPEMAASEASTVIALETKLARASRSNVALQDPQTNYHMMSVAALDALTPHLGWRRYFAAQGLPALHAVNVRQPEYFQAVDRLVADEPVAHWRILLRWWALNSVVYSLSSPFRAQHFRLKQLFTGAAADDPLWKRCVYATDNAMGDLLGREYVRRAFTPEAKARATRIVTTLVDALHDRIEGLAWMSPATKTQALAKLAAMRRNIGYPDKWKDYSGVTVVRGAFLANVLSADRWNAALDWAKIGKPVNRDEWGLSAATVDAYYNPKRNEIVFPAGILQPPFYNPDADDAVNYGSMGAVIGHEMTHDFDDRGRQYDKDGNLKDWWTASDAATFKTEAQKVVRQYSAYTVIDTVTHVNGELTLSEDIADFGGVTIAYAAMERALGPGPHATIDGFSPEQRFFLGWAQMWRQVMRPAFERMIVKTDLHPPAKWRVNGPLSDMPEFKAAWGCTDGDPMVRPAADRPRIW
jgi:putative endopeptidase